MAKRSSTAVVPVYSQPRQQAPIIRISTPKAIATTKPKKAARRHHKRDGGGGSDKVMIGVAVGGAALGFIENQSWITNLPQLPFVGRKGAIAIVAYMLAQRGIGGTIMRDIAIAAAAVSGYQLGKEGKISGPCDDGDLPSRGVSFRNA